jgi:hypothetical protein
MYIYTGGREGRWSIPYLCVCVLSCAAVAPEMSDTKEKEPNIFVGGNIVRKKKRKIDER